MQEMKFWVIWLFINHVFWKLLDYICMDQYLLFEDKQSDKLGGVDKCQFYVFFTIIFGTYLTCMLILFLILTPKVVNLVDLYFILVLI